QQTGRIHDQAASATVNLNQLRTAFANIYATMEAVDGYRSAALQSMRATVDALEQEVAKARGYLERAKGSPALEDGGVAALGTGDLALPAGVPGGD
ncbi:MAG TPA: toxic anion resistance protein, partial [Actinomycetes bacterium]|nr:toxic anion resistance protein [Actinomycetes bacterium]